MDISCRNLWSPLANFNPQPETNWNTANSPRIQQTHHEEEENNEYGPRILQVEKATMTAAVMSTSGSPSRECNKLVRQIAMKLSLKRGERCCSEVVGFIRRRLWFDLLRTCAIALRGYNKNAAPEKIEDLEFNLQPASSQRYTVYIKTNETSACNKTESLYMKQIFTSIEMSSPSVITIYNILT